MNRNQVRDMIQKNSVWCADGICRVKGNLDLQGDQLTVDGRSWRQMFEPFGQMLNEKFNSIEQRLARLEGGLPIIPIPSPRPRPPSMIRPSTGGSHMLPSPQPPQMIRPLDLSMIESMEFRDMISKMYTTSIRYLNNEIDSAQYRGEVTDIRNLMQKLPQPSEQVGARFLQANPHYYQVGTAASAKAGRETQV